MNKIITQTQGGLLTALCVGLNLFLVSGDIHAKDSFETSPGTKGYSFAEAAIESITGDVYSDKAAAPTGKSCHTVICLVQVGTNHG